MTPEFHRPLSADRILPGAVHDIAADAAECAALALRLGIPALHAFACHFRLTPESGGAILAEGHLTARLVRECVVSLDPFETTETENFRVRFVPAGRETDEPDPESDDELPYEGVTIDLGEAAAEQLALALDPYPRKPGADLPGDAGAQDGSPFAALARFRKPD
jgi:uncharacterized metal-binding protein YceD (DUF177 family)